VCRGFGGFQVAGLPPGWRERREGGSCAALRQIPGWRPAGEGQTSAIRSGVPRAIWQWTCL